VWNAVSPWPIRWWGHYFLVVSLVVPGVMALISAFWFGIGGVMDIRRLFRDLKTRTVNHLDNGMVENGVAISDEVKMSDAEKQKVQ